MLRSGKYRSRRTEMDTFQLFRLPPELRDIVYYHALAMPNSEVWDFALKRPTEAPRNFKEYYNPDAKDAQFKASNSVALLKTCKEVYERGLPMFYRESTFYFSRPRDFLKCKHLDWIRHIWFYNLGGWQHKHFDKMIRLKCHFKTFHLTVWTAPGMRCINYLSSHIPIDLVEQWTLPDSDSRLNFMRNFKNMHKHSNLEKRPWNPDDSNPRESSRWYMKPKKPTKPPGTEQDSLRASTDRHAYI